VHAGLSSRNDDCPCVSALGHSSEEGLYRSVLVSSDLGGLPRYKHVDCACEMRLSPRAAGQLTRVRPASLGVTPHIHANIQWPRQPAPAKGTSIPDRLWGGSGEPAGGQIRQGPLVCLLRAERGLRAAPPSTAWTRAELQKSGIFLWGGGSGRFGAEETRSKHGRSRPTRLGEALAQHLTSDSSFELRRHAAKCFSRNCCMAMCSCCSCC
jgi:hypothetical protein